MSKKEVKEENMFFIHEKNRLETFKNWIFSKEQTCSAEKMAEAGFIFIGTSKEPDLVRCFFCSKQLDGWEKDDDPWKEHLNHSSTCKFAISETPEERMTLCQFLDLADSFVEKNIEDRFNSKIAVLDQIFETVESKYCKN